ncbi:MAG: aconitase X catalytic domain-containing protein [Candidatus Micrarchaeota archaeon]|nr:aconitase X catalytic domain-containing protein [Candidatus Micrarchaeota archaeon]
MKLTPEERKMYSGGYGNAVQTAMEILVALGEIYGAKRMVPVASVQVSGVSYHNLGDAGLEFLEDLAKDGKARVLTTLNPAGMDLEDWKHLGISDDFAEKQLRVIRAFAKMGIVVSCTCTPYLVGNLPRFNEHVAWSESSAVTFANSVLGARTNREGGPSALAAALTGRTPEYGLHLDENRQAHVHAHVKARLESTSDFSALGWVLGKKIGNRIPFITGVKRASVEELKSLCASLPTYGGPSLFHIKGITPSKPKKPKDMVVITQDDIEEAYAALNEDEDAVDFVAIGCPHASIGEIRRIAGLLRRRRVKAEFWIATARQTKELADRAGYTKAIEDAGAKFACDTCMAVAPLRGRFRVMAIDSAKGCYYARGSNNFKTRFGTLEECVEAAVSGRWASFRKPRKKGASSG